MAPSRLASTWAWSAVSPASPSSCMIRSARSSRWCGFTVHFVDAHPPAPAASAQPSNVNRSSSLEEYRECTAVLLYALGVVGVEDDVVADVAAQGEALFQRHHQA